MTYRKKPFGVLGLVVVIWLEYGSRIGLRGKTWCMISIDTSFTCAWIWWGILLFPVSLLADSISLHYYYLELVVRFVRIMYITMFCRTGLGKGDVVFLSFISFCVFCCNSNHILSNRFGEVIYYSVCIPAARCMKRKEKRKKYIKKKKSKKNQKEKKREKKKVCFVYCAPKSKEGVLFYFLAATFSISYCFSLL